MPFKRVPIYFLSTAVLMIYPFQHAFAVSCSTNGCWNNHIACSFRPGADCRNNPSSCGECGYVFDPIASSCGCWQDGTFESGSEHPEQRNWCKPDENSDPPLKVKDSCTLPPRGGGGSVGGCTTTTCGNGTCLDNVNCPAFQTPSCCWNSGGNVPCCVGSPIILDLLGTGINLTTPQNGVAFKAGPNARPVRMAWPASKSGNGWLVLDRNGNGTIDDLSEMFGAVTPQPASDAPNGFSALRVFDSPANGGNGNGVIDAGDSVFGNLRIWVDENHDGISQPSELLPLTTAGILVLGTDFTPSKLIDVSSNEFRFAGLVVDVRGSRAVYDVFVRTDSEPTNRSTQ